MCGKAVSNDPFMLKYYLDRCKTQEKSHNVVDHFLPALKFVPDWFVTSKMIEKLDDALFANDDVILINEVSNFWAVKWVFLVQILIILTLMMLILMKMTLKLLSMSDFWLGVIYINSVNQVKRI